MSLGCVDFEEGYRYRSVQHLGNEHPKTHPIGYVKTMQGIWPTAGVKGRVESGSPLCNRRYLLSPGLVSHEVRDGAVERCCVCLEGGMYTEVKSTRWGGIQASFAQEQMCVWCVHMGECGRPV